MHKRNLALAVKSGVKIAYGTDLGEGDHAMEFGLLISNGMSPQQSLVAATRNADGRLAVIAHEPRSGIELVLEAYVEGVIDGPEAERLTRLVALTKVRG